MTTTEEVVYVGAKVGETVGAEDGEAVGGGVGMSLVYVGDRVGLVVAALVG